MSKVVVVSKTRWFTLSPAKVRVCLHCGRNFVSAGPEERQCKNCFKAQKGMRERAAITPETTIIRELVDSIFDLSPWEKSRWAFYYETRRRLQLNVMGLDPDEVAEQVRRCEKMMGMFA